jgi:hypothetical protein
MMPMTGRTWLFLLLPAFSAFADRMAKPEYNLEGELIRPEGYREWVFVGASYGMGYTEPGAQQPEKPKFFHNVYIQPEAYRTYVQTGRFPDKTMLVMEKARPATQASINRQGMFQDEFAGIEVALKDTERFPEKWAYFIFFNSKGEPLRSAKPFPKESCWSCHNQHGAVDNVFVQFYPVLKAARPSQR